MFWTYAILLLFLLSSIALSLTGLFSRFTERQQVDAISSVATTIEDWTAIVQHEQSDLQSTRAYTNFLRSWSYVLGADITVVDRDGDVLHSTCGLRSVPREALEGIPSDKIVTHKSDFNDFYKDRMLSVSVPLHYRGNVVGAIVFNKSLPELRHTVFELVAMFLMASILSLIIASLIIYIQARKISKPIARINKAAQNIAKGNFNERVDITTKDEIGQLASTFNFMASSIERSQALQKSFVSDVSHELRTPMTSITGFVQGMLDGTIDENERYDYLKIVLDESTRLTRLVNDMLEMSKMQSEDYKIDVSAFDINALIGSTLLSLERKIENKGLDINVDFTPDILPVLADKDQIKQVLLNLLDNAIKFCYSDTTIEIKTSVAHGKAQIAISNIGDFISENEQRSLFDRFYKTDKSRANDRTGAGLGLSLVKNILRLHHQNITIKNEPYETNHKTTFEFTLELK